MTCAICQKSIALDIETAADGTTTVTQLKTADLELTGMYDSEEPVCDCDLTEEQLQSLI